jgi:hypothetical protein
VRNGTTDALLGPIAGKPLPHLGLKLKVVGAPRLFDGVLFDLPAQEPLWRCYRAWRSSLG